MKSIKIAVIEDEPDILNILVYNLKREGFEVVTATKGSDALSLVNNEKPDLVLLDLMLPGVSGIDICKAVKNNPESAQIPVIMVTAKAEEPNIIHGLNVGADDYISKPFSPKELIARVKAALRRGKPIESSETDDLVRIGDLVIERSKYLVSFQGTEIKLTATEFKLLNYLASKPGRVFSREQILSRAMGDDVVVIDRNIDVHIRGIRKKMDVTPSLIETIRGVGYRLKKPD